MVSKITATIESVPIWGDENFDANVHENFLKLKELGPQLNKTVDEINETFENIDTYTKTATTKAGEAVQSASTANNAKQTATQQAEIATTKAGKAAQSASDALNYRNQAETFANQASASASSVNASNIVHRTGNENVGGIKNFLVSPIVPTPINNNEVSNKEYTDTKIVKVSSTDNAIVRFNGTTGEVQNSGVIIDDSGNITAGQTVSVLHTSFAGIQIISGNTSFGYVNFGDTDSVNIGQIAYMHSTDSFDFITNKSIKTKITSAGDLLLTSGTGALGYGAGAGGSVTQLTSKSTAVTLNKPTGVINMHNESLASDSTVNFIFNNSLLQAGDGILINNSGWGVYEIEARVVTNGYAAIYVKNTGVTQGQAIPIRYQIIKGSSF
ncbi:hypothetical protein [Aliarcobacter butzleri]|uniref:hypothetical protein n=1 Tax=Aliarcobacter butzleri TaxID=28197 RepID=UPI0021B21574|nr:hypothetical protein [Aliarcobacter butzleri]MCT7596435.1 hypothetical protein [Aliarcobacter butzleri]